MSVCVVLKVSSLESVALDDAVCGASVDVAKEFVVGRVDGEVSRVIEEGRGFFVVCLSVQWHYRVCRLLFHLYMAHWTY